MILLDTTVLVYAVGDEHPLRAACRAIVGAIGAGELAATTTVEVIQEFVHVRSRRRGRADAAMLGASFVDLLSPLLSPSDRELRHGLELFTGNERLGAFDAVLAASTIGADHVVSIVSADRAFATVRGLRYLDPADDRAVEQLRRSP